ncbi:hypothetical protein MTR_4g095420 [Medicago truncatula]|uniref:Uncharacterized protein n=1 Tax=Medicago truncatula TaxID=3880 RepID=G7JCU0_MEDTR|nr:hypothetical protein MTR_4g095420 [Medicago truncatula]
MWNLPTKKMVYGPKIIKAKINLCIELQIERKRGYRIKTLNNIQDAMQNSI